MDLEVGPHPRGLGTLIRDEAGAGWTPILVLGATQAFLGGRAILLQLSESDRARRPLTVRPESEMVAAFTVVAGFGSQIPHAARRGDRHPLALAVRPRSDALHGRCPHEVRISSRPSVSY